MRLLIALAMLLSSLFGSCDSNGGKPEGPFRYYEYKSSTMRSYPLEYYRLEQTEDRGLILFWAKNSSPVAEISVPDEAVQKVTELIMQYRLYTIKSSYKPPCHVLDGTMWHMYYRYSKDSTTCSCDNAWPPKNLWNGILAINAYLNSFVEASLEQTPLSAQPEHEAEP